MPIDENTKMIIQNAYAEGMTPKKIIEKFNLIDIKPKQISDMAHQQKWKKIRDNFTTKTIEKVVEKVSLKVENSFNKIENLTNKSLNFLGDVLDDEDTKTSDKIAAAKVIIDISGLKIQKNVVTTDKNIKKAQEELERILFE